MTMLLSALALLLLGIPATAASPVSFERVTVTDASGRPRDVAIWLPADARAGGRLPLVVILHGNQGLPENHTHTALVLAEAGFVAAAIADGQGISFVERPRHVGRVLDYLLTAWRHHDRLDATRIGIYGFSVGGFTALVTVGAQPDFGRIPPYCAQYQDRVCGVLKESNIDTAVPTSAWSRDARIKAAVVAAPTLGFTFEAPALASITIPIQLWRAARDDVTPHPRHAEVIFNALPMRPDYIVVPNAGHFAFVGCDARTAQRAPVVCRDAPDFDRAAFHRTFNAAVVAFFKARL